MNADQIINEIREALDEPNAKKNYWTSVSGFLGPGAGLTGVTGTDSTKVAKAGDSMTGKLTITKAATGSASALEVINNDTGRGIKVSSTASGVPIYASSDGANGYGVVAAVLGANGIALLGSVGYAGATPSIAVKGQNIGLGSAGYFENYNGSNTNPVIVSNTTGTGNLIELRKSSVIKASVSNAGVIDGTGYTVAGAATITGTIVVKGSDGNDCNLVFTSGLLTSETCP